MLAVLMFLFITGMQAQTVTPSKKYITKELNKVYFNLQEKNEYNFANLPDQCGTIMVQ